MNLYFAPLEGITTYTYRNIHSAIFGGCDAYFAPFINPSDQEKVSKKGMRDIVPDKNRDVNLKVQVLTNNAQSFLKFEDKIKDLGYDEVNINIGCPAARVVQKGRGAGFLQNPDAMDEFFYEIFSKSELKISVKTRIGYTSGDEMERLIKVYNKYPLTQLIIHPRTRQEFYKGQPDIKVFFEAYNISKNKVCYNGDIYSAGDYDNIVNRFPELEGVMIGRGAIKNPAIFREIKCGEPLKTAELIEFSKRLTDAYFELLQSEVFTLYKMKEIWAYTMQNFPEEKKIAKSIKKASRISEFIAAIGQLPEI